ncbi:MAG: tetratricopeptide repeat protein, partial [Rhodanobacteraceae bacterium]
MNFSRFRPLFFLCLGALFLSSCHRTISPDERTARAKLRRALRERSFAAAIPLARDVLRAAPKDNGAWARLAEAEVGLADWTGLRQTLAHWPRAVSRTSAKFDEYRGDLARAEGRPAEAIAAWRKSVTRGGDNARVLTKIARVEETNAHWEKAADAWEETLKLEKSADAFVHCARCFRHLHQWDQAHACLQRAAQFAPNDPIVRQANEQFARLGKFLAEVRDLDRELIVVPNDAERLADRALLFLRAQEPELALDDAKAARRLSPNAIRPRLVAALALRALGQGTAADRFGLQRGTRLETLAPEFLQTLRQLDAEIVTEPKSAELRVNRAWQLNENGQPQWALTDAEKASKLNPASAGARAEASYALAKLGRTAEAYEQIKRATALDP